MSDPARTPKSIDVRVLRQDGPSTKPYWERHRIDYQPEMNVISVLQQVAASAQTVDGKKVAPIAWECGCLEEVCGACTMRINGQVRQSCSALVDRLLEQQPSHIELAPMEKFPVVRDLVVDRSRLFRGLSRVKAWVPVDGYYDMGSGPRQSRPNQEKAYPLSECMSCGCCLDACPQFNKVSVPRLSGESLEDYQQRSDAEYDKHFVGANAISQAMMFNEHPVGGSIAEERIEALMQPGGIAACGNAQNCVAVCPKEIPLTTSIGRAGRAATLYTLKKLLG